MSRDGFLDVGELPAEEPPIEVDSALQPFVGDRMPYLFNRGSYTELGVGLAYLVVGPLVDGLIIPQNSELLGKVLCDVDCLGTHKHRQWGRVVWRADFEWKTAEQLCRVDRTQVPRSGRDRPSPRYLEKPASRRPPGNNLVGRDGDREGRHVMQWDVEDLHGSSTKNGALKGRSELGRVANHNAQSTRTPAPPLPARGGDGRPSVQTLRQ